MFTIYHSNKLEIFIKIIKNIFSGYPMNNPLKPETILVQNKFISQWIKINFALQNSISANIKYIHLDAFFLKIITYISSDILCIDYFSRSVMTWKLMQIIPNLYTRMNCKVLNDYLHEDLNKHKCFQLSKQLAKLFNKYLLYRPDLIDSWEYNNIENLDVNQYWQAIIWKEFIFSLALKNNKSCVKITNPYQYLLDCLKNKNINCSGLPNRIFICDPIDLPQIYLDILQELGKYLDVHLFIINPCLYHKTDTKNDQCLINKTHYTNLHFFLNPKKISKLKIKNTTNKTFIDKYHSLYIDIGYLLYSWNKLIKRKLYFISLLKNTKEVDCFVNCAQNNLLNLMQQDILKFKYCNKKIYTVNNFENKDNKKILEINDRSLTFYRCTSIQNEVETLYNNIISVMCHDASLLPHDIIVMVKDMELYIPVIQSVFGSIDTPIPFVFTDRKIKNIHPIISTLLNLLRLAHSRCSAEEVLILLETPAILAKFNIDEEELKLLRKWISEVGIRWGLNNDIFNELQIPIIHQHTWHSGFTRILLGYAMDSKFKTWNNIYPYDSARKNINLIERLEEFIIQLQHLRNSLLQARTLSNWLFLIHEIINNFFSISCKKEEEAFNILEQYWKQLLEDGINANYDQSVTISLLYNNFLKKIETQSIYKGFLSNGINFCNLVCMNSIPFKAIFLLGMNDSSYSQHMNVVSFDLTEEVKLFNYNSRDIDHHIFLEIFLAARKYLHISFISNDINNNILFIPSILVHEVIEYIAGNFYISGDEKLDQETNTKKISAFLLKKNTNCLYILNNFMISKHKYNNLLTETSSSINNCASYKFHNILDKLSIHTILLNDMLNFYRFPIRSWFQKRLLIKLEQDKILDIPNHEPFMLDALARYQLNKSLLHDLINKQNIQDVYKKICSSGLLPYGAFGELIWIKQYQNINILSHQIAEFDLPIKYKMDISLIIDNINLSGCLSSVQNNGLLRWRPSILSINDGLSLWLEHLVYCSVGGMGNSLMLGINSKWHFMAIPSTLAKKYLSLFLLGYLNGMNDPLFLLRRSCNAWLSGCFQNNTKTISFQDYFQSKARKKLLSTWIGNEYSIGEKNDPYLQRLIHSYDEEECINKIIEAAKKYYLPVFLNNII